MCSYYVDASSKIVLNVTVMTPGRTALERVMQQAASPYEFVDEEEEYSDMKDEDTPHTLTEYQYDEPPATDCKDITLIDERLDCFLESYRFYPWSYVYAKSALDLAMKHIRAKGISGSFDINLQYRDCGDQYGGTSTT